MARLRLTPVLASGARIGPGKAAPLESVRTTGSISAAARAMHGLQARLAVNRQLEPRLRHSRRRAHRRRPSWRRCHARPFGMELLVTYRRLEMRRQVLPPPMDRSHTGQSGPR
jgi:molybdenum-dependent DNA-binding transcriptional regulator ModE